MAGYTNPNKKSKANVRKQDAVKRKLRRKLGWAGLGFILVCLIAASFVFQKPSPGEKVEVMKDQSHLQELTSPHVPYTTDPPTSGPHMPYIATWGVHKEQLPKELLVHNLEDGGVVIYYNQQADKETVARLESIVSKYSEYVVLDPYPEMKDLITLTAWGRMDRLDAFDEKRIDTFIKAYRGIDHHKKT